MNDLPTLKQIRFAAEGIRDKPMSDEECRAWFKRTVETNKREREKKESRG